MYYHMFEEYAVYDQGFQAKRKTSKQQGYHLIYFGVITLSRVPLHAAGA
jgi:hypothetical protein